jgi:hypothetical protein
MDPDSGGPKTCGSGSEPTLLKTDMGTDLSAHGTVCALVADKLLVQDSGNWSRMRQHLPLSAPRKGTKPIDSNLNSSMFNNQDKRVQSNLIPGFECVGHSFVYVDYL